MNPAHELIDLARQDARRPHEAIAVTDALIAEIGARLTGRDVVATPVPGPGWTAAVRFPTDEEPTDYVLLGWNHSRAPVVLLDDGTPAGACDDFSVLRITAPGGHEFETEDFIILSVHASR